MTTKEFGEHLLPEEYRDLLHEPPLLIAEALEVYGLKEAPGTAINPEIERWLDEIGAGRWEREELFKDDATPWCGLFMAAMCWRAKCLVPKQWFRAGNWAAWGFAVEGPCALGDVLVFKRSGGDPVGLYVGEDNQCFHVLGGNQKNAVNIIRIEKRRLTAVRYYYPENIRALRYVLRDPSGAPMSRNEA